MQSNEAPQTSEVATLSATQAARYLRVHPATIRRWITDGILPAQRIGKGEYYRIRQDDLDGMVKAA